MRSEGRPPRLIPRVLFGADLSALFLTWLIVTPRSWVGLLYVTLSLCVMAFGGAHRFRLNPSIPAEAKRLVEDLGFSLIAVVVLGFLLSIENLPLEVAAVSVVAVLVGRALCYMVIRALRRRGWTMEDVVVVGGGPIGCALVRALEEHPEYGLRPLGIVDDVRSCEHALLGGILDMEQVLDETVAAHVIVAFSPIRERHLVELVRSASGANVDIHFVPRFFEVGQATSASGSESIQGIPLSQVRREASCTPAWRLKRAMDVVLALVLILVTLPLMGALAFAVRLGSPGPALFSQPRVGHKGKEFVLLKFRTLPVGYVDRQLNAEATDYQIPVGRFLRRTSLDELPQLFNILRGDMTLVGPRPERKYLVEQFNDEVMGYKDRHRLPMGLTGLAQVHGLRGDSSMEERARFDNYYIEHWSLWTDIVILGRTFSSVIRFIRAAVPGPVSTDDLLAERVGSSRLGTQGVTVQPDVGHVLEGDVVSSPPLA